jgi:hypothetical protein
MGLSGKTFNTNQSVDSRQRHAHTLALGPYGLLRGKFSACLSLLISAYYQQHIMDQILLGGYAKENLHE